MLVVLLVGGQILLGEVFWFFDEIVGVEVYGLLSCVEESFDNRGK